MFRIGLVSLAVLAVAGCDAIRFPGDGRGDPQPVPPAREEPSNVPPGAPGPPPPSAPVEDPYGTGLPGGPVDVDAPEGAEPDSTVDMPAPDETGDEPGEPADQTPTEPEDGSDAAEGTSGDAGDVSQTDETPLSEEPTTEPQPEVGETEPVATPDPEATVPDPVSPDPLSTEPEPAPEPTPDPVPAPAPDPVFSYHAPGQLLPGSGQGAQIETVFAPGIQFPIRAAPAYLQSMVWNFGGGIGGGDECDPRNYNYPWQDNFCETRSANRGSPICPVNRIHQGQDIRVGTAQGCNQLRRTPAAERTLYEVVAVEDGTISNIGTFSVSLRSPGRIYRYMHLNMAELEVSLDQTVKAGDLLGYVSKDFGGTPTTFHLHFEIIQNTAEHGWVHVSPYLSLVEAYERRQNGRGERLSPSVAVASARAVPVIPEGFEIIE